MTDVTDVTDVTDESMEASTGASVTMVSTRRRTSHNRYHDRDQDQGHHRAAACWRGAN